ncbi:MAG: agmatinase [Gemmatimonadaceae bacterium]
MTEPADARRGTPTILGARYDASSSFLRGPADAPAAIRRELRSDSSNMWSEQLFDVGAEGAFADDGDISLGDYPRDAIEEAVSSVLDRGDRPLVLGGDHSITYPILRAVRRHHTPLTILHLDAHSDLYDSYEGDRYSHACPFARIMEEGLCDQLVQVGVRTLTGHQREQADRFGVDVLDMRRWVAGERYVLRHPVYISLDMDVLDPGFAPGVSHRESGGMSPREVLGILHAVDQPLVGADVVEYNPRRDLEDVTAPACAKFVKELIAGMHLHPVVAGR